MKKFVKQSSVLLRYFITYAFNSCGYTIVCVFNLSLGLNRLSRKYAIFMKGKDAQSLEKLFKRKFDLIEKLAVNSEINQKILQSWKNCRI